MSFDHNAFATTRPAFQPSEYYDIGLDHSMDGNLDGEDVNSYIDGVAQNGPESAADLLELQAAGCEIDAADLENFVKAGGQLTGDDIVSFVANGGTLTADNYKFFSENGTQFNPQQTLIMESALGADLNGDSQVPESHVAQAYLGQYATPKPEDGYMTSGGDILAEPALGGPDFGNIDPANLLGLLTQQPETDGGSGNEPQLTKPSSWLR